jgi:hypothetical protein
LKTLPRTHPIKQSPLHKLGNHRRLAAILRVDSKTLRRLARIGGTGYSEWDEISETGKTRHIENPKPGLKRAQARLATLLGMIEAPDFLTCPVKGRSYVTNARHHVGSAEVVTLDISKYFPTTRWKRVYWFFNKRMNMPADTAWTLASLATLDGHLPTGSPLSPIMAYLAHEDMWLAVAKLAKSAGCRLTVYMDDLTISGDRVPESLVWTIKKEIHKTGLRLNNRKERRFSGGEAVITGLIVTESSVKIPKRSHLKLSVTRKAFANEPEGPVRAKIKRRMKGMEAQHKQVLNS